MLTAVSIIAAAIAFASYQVRPTMPAMIVATRASSSGFYGLFQLSGDRVRYCNAATDQRVMDCTSWE
jgi:hypothetical protein